MKRRRLGFITTDAVLCRCKCGAPVLKARDEGVLAVVDPWPADRLTEARAIITGRWTYTLTHRHLYRRDGAIRPGPVLIQHLCQSPLTQPVPLPPSNAPNDAPNDQPPY